MTEVTAALPVPDPVAAAAERSTDAIMHGARRVWLAGLGIVAVAAEQAQTAFEMLEHKGQEIEPTVTAPFRRASETANRLAQRAGESLKRAGDAVNSGTTSVAGIGRRFKRADIREEVSRIVEEKLSVALEHLDLPSRSDLQALADKIDELAAKSKRHRESRED